MIAAWSEEEEEVLRQLYPSSLQIELLQAIPDKTAAQIKKRASQLEVKRYYWHIDQTNRFHWTICYTDLQAAATFTSTTEEQAFLWQEINTMAQNTQRGQLAASWFLPVDMVSFVHALDVTNEIESGKLRTLASWLSHVSTRLK